ncbi:MAG: hypothetical protein U1F43_07510 [Myxococcota bacterium]
MGLGWNGMMMAMALVAAPLAARATPPRPDDPIGSGEAGGDASPQVPAKPIDARSATATAPPCKKDGSAPFVYAIGGSTMQIVFGPMLGKRLAKDGFKVEKLGKSASGLARFDYYDWPEQARTILAASDPDVFVVAIGSNDGQSLREVGGKWFPLDRPEWRVEYARRIDAFLDELAGKDRHRAVIWLGPAAHSVDEKRRRGKVVGDVIRERVKAFDGRAWYVDVFARTSTADGGALNELRVPGSDDPVALRTADGFHLTRPGVESIQLAPVMAILGRCQVGGH